MRHRYIVLLGFGLTLAACDSSDDAVQLGGGGAGGAGAGGGAGAPRAPGECPAPRAGEPSRWAKNPDTGECCAYSYATAALLQSGPAFSTQAECEAECRCAQLDTFDESFGAYDTERTSLDCRCGSGGCPTSVDEAIEMLCAPGRNVSRVEGCGLSFIVANDGFTSLGWLFEPGQAGDAGSSGASLVGAFEASDVPFTPCSTFVWVAGRDFDCEDTIECPVCGLASEEVPAGCE